ncbi:predicted protein [Nematostella vectensis]|uniref:Protein-tyrosine-phosphatase n=2 Tax=Nematostella vectensis TaxID=45351 RepID=A7SE41_NEMVE|nr:predicted protein [Nematostella vectensis]|eukprot:XP_001630106.1 predicted protein [Nematostella vectensis]
MWDRNVMSSCELVEDRLFFVTVACKPRNSPSFHYFGVDHDWTLDGCKLFDTPYFGPSNLAGIYRFCCLVNTKLHMVPASKKIVMYTTAEDDLESTKKRTRAIFLCGAFAVCQLNMSAEEAYQAMERQFRPNSVMFYCDINGNKSHDLNILDCLKGFEKAISRGFFSFEDFDLNRYEEDEKAFDSNWIVPGKILAMSDPQRRNEVKASRFAKLRKHFRQNGVKTVVRLNRDDNMIKYGLVYDARCFTANGFAHSDQYFEDGGIPTKAIVKRFTRILDHCEGAVAIHCRAGLGRTGTLIACYLIKQYKFSAAEAVGWLRICRPGSVSSLQHCFLEHKQEAIQRGYTEDLTLEDLSETMRKNFNIMALAPRKDEKVA